MRQQAIRACDIEPIHTPGLVQQHGVLFTLASDGRVLSVSDNSANFTGRLPADILGRHICSIFKADPEARPSNDACFPRRPVSQGTVEEWGRVVATTGEQVALEALSHRNSQDTWIVECELAEGVGLRFEPQERHFHRQIQRAQQQLYDAVNLQSLVDRAVEQISTCFGFDRVMAYRFDALWNGTVIAERRRAHLSSYMNQKFPASDIPQQARLTFTHNWMRCIPDVRFIPCALVSAGGAAQAEPLNMMLCHLRAPSPTHLEYLRNMRVRSTVTISLISGGQLWGLIACHHMTPVELSYERRQAAEVLGRTTSALLATKEANDSSEYRRETQRVQEKLFISMTNENGLVPGLIKASPNVLDLVSETESSAAIFFEGRWSFLGAVPPVSELNGLVKWLAREKANLEVWHTEMLVSEYPVSDDFSRVASGVLAVNVPKSDNTYVLWFRPEVPRLIDWAGRPEKDLIVDAAGAHLHPRKSFERWQEVIKSRSLPWQPVEIEAATVLRKNLIELDLKRQFRREQRARADTEAEKYRFEFLAGVTGILNQSLDYEATLREFAKSLVQSFCDWSCIYVASEQGLKRSIICHATSEGNKVAQELWAFDPIFAYLAPQTAGVLERYESVCVSRVYTWIKHAKPSPYLKFLTTRLGAESLLLLPIVARGKLLGVIKCVRSSRGHPFTQDDFRLGSQLTERAASCIDNALLYRASQQAIQARDHVMGVVSHDLRNPLGAIRLTADRIIRRYAKQDLGELPDLVSRGLEKIQTACRRMNGLIEDVLSVSKIEAGHYTVDLEPIAVSLLLQQAIDLLEPLAEAAHVTLIAPDSTRGLQASCDTDRVLQVFSNLVGNAIKFTPAEGVITLGAVAKRDVILFSIADTGPGIASGHLPHLFDRYWQAARTARHGAGLGLAIAKGIVEAHGGKIYVESTEGEGTCFYFTLKSL